MAERRSLWNVAAELALGAMLLLTRMIQIPTRVVVVAVTCASASFAAAELELPSQLPSPHDAKRVLRVAYPWLGHPVYDYLDRSEVVSDLPLLSRTRPYLIGLKVFAQRDETVTGKESTRFRQEAAVRTANGGGVYYSSPSEWRTLRDKALGHSSAVSWIYADGYHFGHTSFGAESGNRFNATLQAVYGFEYIDTGDELNPISRFTGGARLEGGYAGRLRFMMDFRDHTESGNGPYWRREQLYEDRWPAVALKGQNSTSYDVSESFIQYYGPDLSIAAGRGRHFWGSSRFGSLVLNSHSPPFDYIRFDAALEDRASPRALFYTFLHGFLESAVPADTLYVTPDGRPRTINAQKFLTAQRLEVRPHTDVLVGLSQIVVYGDRGPQLGYLTPLNFLYSVQHSNDDKDNFLLALDGAWRAVRGLKVYAELLFDDIAVRDMMTSSGNNKSAYTVGLHGTIPRRVWSNVDATLEYTKVRPFVYTHFFSTNAYTHWYSPLGYTREPNSEFITAEVRGTFYPLQVALHWSRQNHGSNTLERNVGGNINAPNFSGNNNIFPFLSGRFERVVRAGVRIRWEMLPGLFLFGDNIAFQRSLEPDRMEWRGGFAWNR